MWMQEQISKQDRIRDNKTKIVAEDNRINKQKDKIINIIKLEGK